MTDERRILELLGLAARAGSVVSGTGAVRAAVREKKLRRVLLAVDAAPGQRGKLVPLLDAVGIPYHVQFDQVELGAAIGRAPVSAVGVAGDGFAQRLGELVADLSPRRD